MLHHVRIERVRSVLARRVSLAPLTLLVGKNGAGKSSILRAIEVAAQAAIALQANPAARPGTRRAHLRRRGLLHESILQDAERYGYTRLLQSTVEVGTGIDGALRIEQRRTRGTVRSTYVIEGGDPHAICSSLASVRFINAERVELGAASAPSALTDHLKQDLAITYRSKEKTSTFLSIGRSMFEMNWTLGVDNEGSMCVTDNAIGPSGIWVPLRLASLGTRQFCTIALASLSLPPGGTLVVEEPELSLHPAAQVAAGEFLGESVTNRGVQIIASTHSHYVVLGVLKLVRTGVLKASDVSILHCEKGRYGTTVHRLPLDDFACLDGWIPSFAAVDDEVFRDWSSQMGREEP